MRVWARRHAVLKANGEWTAKCGFCGRCLWQASQPKALARLEFHITMAHAGLLKAMRINSVKG